MGGGEGSHFGSAAKFGLLWLLAPILHLCEVKADEWLGSFKLAWLPLPGTGAAGHCWEEPQGCNVQGNAEVLHTEEGPSVSSEALSTV